MRAGPIEDGPPPPGRYAPRSDLSRLVAEIPPGKCRVFEVPPGLTVDEAQRRIARRALYYWGKGGHITQLQDGGRTVRVWRLTEDQRLAYLAARRKHREAKASSEAADR